MNHSKISLAWVSNLKGQEREDFKTLVTSSAVLERLKQILEGFEDEVSQNEASETDYRSSDWAYLQAHRNGKKEMLRKIYSLVAHL
jgi:hypothetical protein